MRRPRRIVVMVELETGCTLAEVRRLVRKGTVPGRVVQLQANLIRPAGTQR